ncbi:DUF2493 domain-containing protein [Bosea sp. NPDC055332]
MRILVCGGRNYADRAALYATLDKIVPRTPEDEYGNWLPAGVTIIHGACPTGADHMADEYAVVNWCAFEEYPADWRKHGRAAGPIRNQQMLDEGKPDVVVAAPGGKGTADMVRRANAANIPVIEVPAHVH